MNVELKDAFYRDLVSTKIAYYLMTVIEEHWDLVGDMRDYIYTYLKYQYKHTYVVIYSEFLYNVSYEWVKDTAIQILSNRIFMLLADCDLVDYIDKDNTIATIKGYIDPKKIYDILINEIKNLEE